MSPYAAQAVSGLLAAAAEQCSPMEAAVLADGSVEIRTQDSEATVVLDEATARYQLHTARGRRIVDDSGWSGPAGEGYRDDESIGGGASWRGVAGKTYGWRFDATFDPRKKHFDADPTGRIDDLVEVTLAPLGWTREWTDTEKVLPFVAGILFVVVYVVLITAGIDLVRNDPGITTTLIVLAGAGVMAWFAFSVVRSIVGARSGG